MNPPDLDASVDSTSSLAPELADWLSLETEPDLGKPDAQRARWNTLIDQLARIVIGFGAAVLAVLFRSLLGLPLDVLPFFLVVIAVCLVTVFAGFLGGLTTMISGGLLTWYFLLDPSGSWATQGPGGYALLGYFAVTSFILGTSQLYRLSERRRQAVAMQMAVQEAQHQSLFAREMSHRLKNAMTIVQAIAGQTFSRDTPELAKFDGRLKALASAHNLLNEHVKQPSASIDDVIETAIRPFRDDDCRFRIKGDPLPLPDQQVVSLTLALHELATNAVKYGALSHADGWVSIEWSAADGSFQLEWKEHDGPPVSRPSFKGFGSRLLERAGLDAELEFEEDGLRCVLRSQR